MKSFYQIILGGLFFFLAAAPLPTNAQLLVGEVIKAGVTKAIKAVDLKIQRLQNETIKLQNAQKVLENQLSLHRLREIADWSEKQRAQYEQYFRELQEIKAAISSSRRLRDVLRTQQDFVREYKRVQDGLRQDRGFSLEERLHLEKTYAALLSEVHRQMEHLLVVTTPHKTQMRDGDRLAFIAETGTRLETLLQDLRRLHHRHLSLALQRAQTKQEVTSLLYLYGLPSFPLQP